ncbi:hypothetical protein KCU83_g3358, partial [Aureobasidium melanogenum]
MPYLCPNGTLGQIIVQPAYPNPRPPIGKRAWTLEERLISPRLLGFGTNFLSWHCTSANFIFDGTKTLGDPDSPFVPTRYSQLDGLIRDVRLGRISESCPKKELRDRLCCWTLLVEEYTQRGLTSPEDRLRALGGLAATFQDLLPQCNYRAGLWHGTGPNNRNLLLSQLLWVYNPDYKGQPITLPVDPLAPSWSWASSSSEARWHPEFRDFLTTKVPDAFWDGNDDLADILACTCTPTSERIIYGQVRDARVTIRGPFRTTIAFPRFEGHVRFLPGVLGPEFVHVNLDGDYLGMDESSYYDVLQSKKYGQLSRSRRLDKARRERLSYSELLEASGRGYRQIIENSGVLSFLLLKQRSGLVLIRVKGANLYKRAGVFALVDVRALKGSKYPSHKQIMKEELLRSFSQPVEGDYLGNDLEARAAFFGDSVETVTII